MNRQRQGLKTKEILIIAPHFEMFIQGQAVATRPFLQSANVLLPNPYFSSVVPRLPYLSRRFRFLEMLNKQNKPSGFQFAYPKYFTLPLKIMQKRNSYLVTKSCMKSVSRRACLFDFVHAHFLDSGFVGAKLKRRYNKPLIVTAHGGDFYDLPFRDSWYHGLARYVLSEADRVITVSKSNQEKLLALGANPNKLVVIPNGYEDNLFKRISKSVARDKLSLPQDKKIVLTVGNLKPEKGHIYLLDAFKLVSQRRSDTTLLVVGAGPLLETLEKRTKYLNLENKVFFVGAKAHEQIPLWMNACDVFVLPSLMESFGVVLLEAMACGKPVVGSFVGGVPEVVTKRDLGILVKPADSVALAHGILSALERVWNTDIILEYVERFSWSNLADNIVNVYEDVLNGR
jgi:glycosyltransferase involved in cell wall biosynthesis